MGLLPYGRHFIDDDDVAAVVEALRSDWLTTGPKVGEFEARLAEKVGAKYAVVFNSGTAALHAAYFAAGVGPGDEVITTPITFAATANAALYLGARPVFVDIESDTININPEKINDAISNKTKVIAPVDFSGHPCDLGAIREIADKKGLIVVEDAAHALGAAYKGNPIGSIADMTVFSFHPVKHITTGEGGAVTTDKQEFYQKLRSFRNHGIVKGLDQMTEYHGPWYYEMHYLGYNYRITDIQCALGLSQLEKLDAFIEKRREIAAAYYRLLSDLEYLELPTVRQLVEPAWHLYIIKIKTNKVSRLALFERMLTRGLGVQVHYIPVYWHPYYQKLGYRKGICSCAEDYYAKAISIPIFPAMSDSEVERVACAIKEEIHFLLEAGT
ncbi:aminotransferase DegT [Clostridiales bacterium PH28_bin88]|nr:aminotransferase DegT [Clostridiales bacterium PH28_bin88]